MRVILWSPFCKLEMCCTSCSDGLAKGTQQTTGGIKFWTWTVWLSREFYNHRPKPAGKSECGSTLASSYIVMKPPRWTTATWNGHMRATVCMCEHLPQFPTWHSWCSIQGWSYILSLSLSGRAPVILTCLKQTPPLKAGPAPSGTDIPEPQNWPLLDF